MAGGRIMQGLLVAGYPSRGSASREGMQVGQGGEPRAETGFVEPCLGVQRRPGRHAQQRRVQLRAKRPDPV